MSLTLPSTNQCTLCKSTLISCLIILYCKVCATQPQCMGGGRFTSTVRNPGVHVAPPCGAPRSDPWGMWMAATQTVAGCPDVLSTQLDRRMSCCWLDLSKATESDRCHLIFCYFCSCHSNILSWPVRIWKDLSTSGRNQTQIVLLKWPICITFNQTYF